MIQPKYVTFDQSKKLKIKGFNEECSSLYNEQGEPSSTKMGMNGLPNNYTGFYAKPEQWQVVEWLLEEYGIYISVDMLHDEGETGFWYYIRQKKDDDEAVCSKEYPSPQEAYSAAFDYVLNNLI